MRTLLIRHIVVGALCPLLGMPVAVAWSQFSTCTVTGIILDHQNSRVSGAEVIVRRIELDGDLITQGPRKYTSNDTGLVSFIVPRNSTGYVYAPVSGYNVYGGLFVEFPNAATATLETLQPVRGLTAQNAETTISSEVTTLDFDANFTVTETPTREANITIATGAISSADIADGTIVNADVNASAAIAISKLATGSSAQMIVAASDGTPTYRTLSGDVTISNTGVTAIEAGVIVNADISASAAIAHTKLASGSAAQVMLGNGSGVPTMTTISGDATVNSSGVVALADGAASLNELSDVDISGAVSGNSLSRRADGTWVDSTIAGSGDITGVTAGTGLGGGGLSGDVTVNVLAAGGLTVSSDSVRIDSTSPLLIGDTLEVDVFGLLDTTSTNGGDLTPARLSVRRSILYWAFSDAASDTLIFSMALSGYVDSLEYVVIVGRVNDSDGSGNYRFNLLWETVAHDAAVQNDLVYTNSYAFTKATEDSLDNVQYRVTLPAGASKSINGVRWLDGAIIRVGGDGADTAAGNFDMLGLLLGFSRNRGGI